MRSAGLRAADPDWASLKGVRVAAERPDRLGVAVHGYRTLAWAGARLQRWDCVRRGGAGGLGLRGTGQLTWCGKGFKVGRGN